MPKGLKRYYGRGDLHFITFSCYRRLPLLGSARRRDLFLRSLEAVREKYRLIIFGYVVMPEHVHLLLGEPEHEDLSVAIKALKQSVARRVLLRSRKRSSGQTEMFAAGAAPTRFWQARFYDFNVFTDKKFTEKLRYIHRNPVKRGLVPSPELWRWSSFRWYYYGEAGIVRLQEDFADNPLRRSAAAG